MCSAGKRTFNPIFTKVKEKLKESEQPPKWVLIIVGATPSSLDAPISSQQQPYGGSYGEDQQHPQSQQYTSPPQMGYAGSSAYPATNPSTVSPPITTPPRAPAPDAEAPAQSYLPEAPSTPRPHVTEQPAPKSPPVSAASASGAASSGSAASAAVAESSGDRPYLDLCKISARFPDTLPFLIPVSQSSFSGQETDAIDR